MTLSNDQLVESAKEFTDSYVRPNVQLFEQQGVSRETIEKMAEFNITNSILPRDFGGLGVDALTYGRITEEVGKGCNSVRALLTVNTSLVGETLAKLGSENQQQKYLPKIASGEKIACFALSEPGAGSDAASIQTSYRETEDGFVLNGQKKWITYGAIADIFLVMAVNEADQKICAFIVERDFGGIATRPMSGLMASQGAHLAEIQFDNVVIPKEQLLGRVGMGFSIVANVALFYGRYSIAWGGLAIMGAALEEMVTYSRTRVQFGKKISQNQLIKGIIADSATALHAGRALCEKIARLRNADDDRAFTETNIAKYFTSKAAVEVSNNAVQVFGGNGICNTYGVERLFREAKVLEIIEGSSQIQQMMISEKALRDYYKPALKKSYPEWGKKVVSESKEKSALETA